VPCNVSKHYQQRVRQARVEVCNKAVHSQLMPSTPEPSKCHLQQPAARCICMATWSAPCTLAKQTPACSMDALMSRVKKCWVQDPDIAVLLSAAYHALSHVVSDLAGV
jgi:hypothetical protein